MSRTAKLSNEAAQGPPLRIGEVSRESGLSVETLRFYERRGLLGRPRRTHANYRVYDREVLERLSFIRRAQLIGFSLDEIQQIISESEQGRAPCRAVREMARHKLVELDARLNELRRHRKELAGLLRDWDGSEDDPGHFCGLIEASEVQTAAPGGAGWRRARKGEKR